MNILVSNDDGIYAPGLWALVSGLKAAGNVFVVAPDREQSATGTAVTLRQPLRVQKARPLVDGIEAFSVEGTPCDAVILALGKLVPVNIDIVVSGINQGPNLGDDVLISGTVGAALQGYLRGLPAIAISIASLNGAHVATAARLAALLCQRVESGELPKDLFLNVNLPEQPPEKLKGICFTSLAHRTHIETVSEGHDGRREYYWLVRQKLAAERDQSTDLGALELGYVTLSDLGAILFGKPGVTVTSGFCDALLKSLLRG